MGIQLQNALTEWRHFEGYLTTEEKLASLHDVQGQLIDFLLLKEKLPTTAPTTPTARTVEGHWDADKMVYSYTTPTTPPSLPSDQVDTPSSPVAPSSECVHPTYQLVVAVRDSKGTLMVQCRQCHVYLWFEPTPAQGVDPTFSTSARGASSRFVENSVEESVPSVLSGLIKSFDGLKDFSPVTEAHKGYQEGLGMAQGWIEMKLRQLEKGK